MNSLYLSNSKITFGLLLRYLTLAPLLLPMFIIHKIQEKTGNYNLIPNKICVFVVKLFKINQKCIDKNGDKYHTFFIFGRFFGICVKRGL